MRRPRSPLAAIALGILVAIGGWLVLSPLDANDLVGGDEGYYGTMARNVLASPRYLASTSLSPLGPPGDKPPLYPALLALSGNRTTGARGRMGPRDKPEDDI